MIEDVPTRVWVLILIGLIAFAPARYIYRHLAHSPTRRDIAQPKEDLSWRTLRQFATNIAILCVLAGLTAYIFTPAAEEFAKSPSFWPILMTALAAFCIYWFIEGLAKGQIEPIVKGDLGPYNRDDHPKRYWASIAWNTLLTGLLIWMVFNMWTNPEWSW